MIAMLFAGCAPKKQETAAHAPTSAPKKATLVMGTNAEFEPFEYRNDKNEVVGFDVDMSKKIAEKAAQELKIEDMNFDSLIAALDSGKIDMAVAGMSVTEERKQNVDFSDFYYTSKQVIVVKKGSAIKTKALPLVNLFFIPSLPSAGEIKPNATALAAAS
jgi:polar amino acid transport system substrate-binding protein